MWQPFRRKLAFQMTLGWIGLSLFAEQGDYDPIAG